MDGVVAARRAIGKGFQRRFIRRAWQAVLGAAEEGEISRLRVGHRRSMPALFDEATLGIRLGEALQRS